MPKLKTHSGAGKRFLVTAKRKVKRRCANRNHILTKKSPKQKRQLRVAAGTLKKCDAKLVLRMLRGG